MDAERSGRAMTDAAIDREIQAALAVDPSPQFVARVRTRIAAEPARAVPWLSWKLVASGAMAALIVIASVLMRPGEHTFNARPEPLDSPLIPSQSKAQLAQDRPVEERARAETPKARTRTRRADQPPPRLRRSAEASAKAETPQARRQPEPEVLLDPAETRALRRLITGTREGTLDLSAALQATTPAAMDLPPLSQITIPLITIDAITPEAGEEGARP